MHKNIVFDIGNVFYKWNPNSIIQKLHLAKEDEHYISECVFSNWNMLDYGYSIEDFVNKCNHDLPERLQGIPFHLAHSWMYYLVDEKIEQTHKLLKELRKNHKVYLLSNIPENVMEHLDILTIANEVDGFVFSGVVKLHKPEPIIFKYLLDTYNLNAEECLFVDDLVANCKGANSVGMDAFVFDYNKFEDFTDYLKKNNDL